MTPVPGVRVPGLPAAKTKCLRFSKILTGAWLLSNS